MKKILDVVNLTVNIDDLNILDNISFPIYKNKITSIIGSSGCGKSTLLKSLNRSIESLNSKIKGDVFLDEESIFSIKEQEVKKHIGLILQNPTPFPFSVYKNMVYALEYFKLKDKGKIQEIVIDKLKKVGLYDEIKENFNIDARKLSGGQQQRLCIARSLTVEPKVILLDEPCSALDIKNIFHIEETLKELKKDYTIVIVTHNLSQAKRISDYTLYIEDGKVIEFNNTKELFESPKKLETKEYISYMG